MNRSIKFRIWDKKNNKFWHKMDGFVASGTIINAEGVPGITYEETKFAFFDSEFLVIQFFTGLLDKNGVEIYEKDIVRQKFYKYPDQPREELIDEFIGEVIWDHYFTRFALARPEMEDCCEFKTISYGNVKLEVIGNMMENPELLSLKTDMACDEQRCSKENGINTAQTSAERDDS